MNKLSIDEQQALHLIQSDEDYTRYFFARAKSWRWFHPLKELEYFDPQQIRFDERGNATFWIVLNYLERLSEQIKEEPGQNGERGQELLQIVGDLVRFSHDTRPVNNLHIWWICAKIVNNLPAAMVKEDVPIVDQADGSGVKYGFRTWLLTWTNPDLAADLAVTDVAAKLLPKFLRDPETMEYAEAIADVITRIKPSGKRSALDGKDDAVLVCDDYWVLDAFKKHHRELGASCSLDLVYKIADKLEKALKYKRQNFAVEIRIGEDIYELSIARIALNDLKTGEIGFKEGSYPCVLKRYAPEQIKGLDLTENLIALWNIKPEVERAQFTVEAATKDEFISKTRSNLPADIPWDSADDLEGRIAALFEGLYEDYSSVWCRSLGNGPEHQHDAEGILTIVLRDLVSARCDAKREDGRRILIDFLGDKYRFPIFRKMVLLCAGRFWADYSELFEKFIEMNPDALQESDYEVELQDALRQHSRELNLGLAAKLKALIENVPRYYTREGEEAVAHWKYKWLSPLRDNSDFVAAYNEAKQRVKPKGDKPYEPDRSAFRGGIVGHKSPVSQAEILKMLTAGELVKYLNEFQGADFWHGTFEGEPDKEGLAGELQAAVKAEPKKFIEVLEIFHQVSHFYINTILEGLRAAWSEGKNLDSDDWGKILAFCLKFISRDREAFIKDAIAAHGEDSGDGRYLYAVETIVRLIVDGCRDDKRAFDPKHFGTTEKIFDTVLSLLKSERCDDVQREALNYALNTTPGKVVEDYIVFSLRVARAMGAKPENWGSLKYERFFDADLVEAPIWFGCYLPNMMYLDEKYTLSKVRAFSERSADDCEWRKFMEGFLSGSQINGKIYSLMRPHYLTALEGKTFEGGAEERLVNHLCIGYLWGLDLLQKENADGQPSLFWKMLDEASIPEKRGRWLDVAEHFWQCTSRTRRKDGKGEEPDSETKKRILEFWAWTYREQEFVRARLGEDYGKFLGRMTYLTILLDEIDEEKEKWLLLSAAHVDEHHGVSFFLEYLSDFEGLDSIKRAGKIFRKVLEITTPTFKQEDIELIVEKLYKVGLNDPDAHEAANEICETYGRRGFHFLKPLWDKYRK